MMNQRCDHRMFSVLIVLILTFGLVGPVVAAATVIRIEAEAKASFGESGDLNSVEFSIKNNGDEAARAIFVELPLANEKYPVVDMLGANESKVLSVPVAGFAEIKEQTGDYLFPYRVLYKDNYGYEFSAPFYIAVTRLPSPSRAISITFSDLDTVNSVNLSKQATATVAVTNVSQGPIIINKMEPFSASEISVRFERQLELPLTLQPGAETTLTIGVKKLQALPNSNYPVMVMVSGESGGKHFAQMDRFMARIVAPEHSYKLLVLAGSVIFLSAVVVIWLVRRSR